MSKPLAYPEAQAHLGIFGELVGARSFHWVKESLRKDFVLWPYLANWQSGRKVVLRNLSAKQHNKSDNDEDDDKLFLPRALYAEWEEWQWIDFLLGWGLCLDTGKRERVEVILKRCISLLWIKRKGTLTLISHQPFLQKFVALAPSESFSTPSWCQQQPELFLCSSWWNISKDGQQKQWWEELGNKHICHINQSNLWSTHRLLTLRQCEL